MHVNINTWFFLTELSNIDALIVTIIKYTIHKARMNNSIPSLTTMVNALKAEARIQYTSSKINNSSENFEAKWTGLRSILE